VARFGLLKGFMMVKFKVGDTIQRLGPHPDGCANSGKIKDILLHGFVALEDGSCHNINNIKKIKSNVSEGPIRTVTKRELVAGMYNRVSVTKMRPDNTIHVGICDPMSSNDLRAAAILFNELADYLEAQ
jgi:hypothetical protein